MLAPESRESVAHCNESLLLQRRRRTQLVALLLVELAQKLLDDGDAIHLSHSLQHGLDSILAATYALAHACLRRIAGDRFALLSRPRCAGACRAQLLRLLPPCITLLPHARQSPPHGWWRQLM
eukprot:6172812-Pleurochrysis_carterae.AAC.1